MEKFTNPLERVRIASPCAANWEEMQGDERKRFCGECRLNVYNLSAMTKREAETLLINSEGRLCVRFYRRADGTILTQDCPVGWARVKQRVSRIATAAFSMIAGFFGGFAAFSQLTNIEQEMFEQVAVEQSNDSQDENERLLIWAKQPLYVEAKTTMGKVAVDPSAFRERNGISKNAFVGSMAGISSLEDEPVEAWIK